MRVMQMLAGAPTGGAETFFVSLVCALRRAGLDQTAVIRAHEDRVAALRACGLEPIELPFGKLVDITTGAALKRLIAEERPDIVLAYMNRAASWMPPGPHLKLARIGGYYNIKYYRRCDHLLCITEDIRRHMIDQGWPAARTHHMPNFAMIDDHPPQDRAALDTPGEVPVLLVPSRLHPAKGLDTMLHALTRIPDAWLWLAGEGPERERLQRLAAELGVSGRVRFLGWREDTGALYRAADVVVFPSRYEPFGTVSLEAWAHGKPLVAADAPGPAGLVRPEEDALLVPRDDAGALADAVRRVLHSPALAARLVANGTARYEAEFTEAACVRRYTKLFERLLKEHGAVKESA